MKRSMLLVVLLAFVSAAANAASQEGLIPQGSQKRPANDMRLVGAEDMLGSVVVGRSGEKLAKVDGVVLDLHLGTISYVLLGAAGTLGDNRIAVPWERFTTVKSDTLALDADRQTLLKAPSFAQNDWGRLSKDTRWGKGIAGYWGSSEVAGVAGVPQGGGLTLVRADEMRGWPVIGKNGQNIAEVRRVILNIANGTIATLLVAAAGPVDASDIRIPIPYQKFAVSPNNALILNADMQTLANAPTVQESGWGKIGTDVAWNRNVYSYWGVGYPSIASAAGEAEAARLTPMSRQEGQ